MNKYIATFYSHFGAVLYYKALKKQGVSAKLMPVPRKVSSSCGTCVSYEHDSAIYPGDRELDRELDCELDSVYLEDNNSFIDCAI
jgi:hypothetical protein